MDDASRSRSGFRAEVLAAAEHLSARLPDLRELGREKEVIVYSFGTRGSDLARQLRASGIGCVIFDNSTVALERAREEGFAVTSDLGLDRPLVVAAGQNQLSILGDLAQPAWSLAEGLYAFDLSNQCGRARLFSERVPALVDALYEVYHRLDDECRAGFLDVLLYRASLDVGRIAGTRLPVAQMWTPPASVCGVRSFCDVGAYDGDTLGAMKAVFPGLAATLAVEPNPDLISRIEAMARSLGLAHRSHAGAAWSHPTRINLHTPAQRHDVDPRGGHGQHPRRRPRPHRRSRPLRLREVRCRGRGSAVA